MCGAITVLRSAYYGGDGVDAGTRPARALVSILMPPPRNASFAQRATGRHPSGSGVPMSPYSSQNCLESRYSHAVVELDQCGKRHEA
jgi:hypothetical protein